MKDKLIKDLLHWGLFRLAISLTPLIFGIWKAFGTIENASFSLALGKVISNGELLLICIALLAVNIGDLIKEKTEWKKLMITFTGCSIFLALFMALVFAEINNNSSIKSDYILSTSKNFFISTIIVCISSILLPKTTEE